MKKLRKNNFDKSSTGTDIELSCFYDTDLSRMYFEEEIEILQHSGYRNTSVGYFHGQGDNSDTVKFIVKGERDKKIQFLEGVTNFDVSEISSWDTDTLDSEILGNLEDINLINYALDKIESPEGLEIIPNKNIITLTTRGYCQGDYAKVLYCPEDLEKCWGSPAKQESIQEQVNHLFWDSVIYCKFTINGKEYDYYDAPVCSEDSYGFKRDKFIEYVAKESGVSVEILESFVPDYPEYN